MYHTIDNILTITVNDWKNAGLTENQFKKDSCKGDLSIFRRGINGNTRIDVRSIKRPERLAAIEAAFGKVEEKARLSIFHVEIDQEAQAFFIGYRKPDGSPLDAERIKEYTNKASIFRGLKNGMKRNIEGLARTGDRLKLGVFYKNACNYYNLHAAGVEDGKKDVEAKFPAPMYANVRSFERAFKLYLKEGLSSIIHSNIGNDAARLVSYRMEKLILALWIRNNKPFKNEVHGLYMDFVCGETEFFDKSTGECYRPEDFRYIPKGKNKSPRPIAISVSTIWNILKKHMNDAATAGKRDGNYIAVVEKRPYHFRSAPKYSLSKLSMDDADLSRTLKNGGRVHRYMMADVMSGYWFTPVYSKNDLSQEDVWQCFRNMFCELDMMGLPVPGEIEHEHFLVDGIMANEAFRKVFPFTTISSHSRNKRAEHMIKALKWGVAHNNNHTRGRFYGKGCYRTPKVRAKGDWVEKKYDYDVIVEDDLRDIEEHNNSLHPKQKTYPGMTRKEVFLAYINKDLPYMEKWYIYRFIGNETLTSLRNNNHLACNNQTFIIESFETLNKMRPGNVDLTAYWIPNEEGLADKVYLYQGDVYVGSGIDVNQVRYNESRFERTDLDKANKLFQDKRAAKFDHMARETRNDIPKLGISNKYKELPIPEEVEVMEEKAMELDFEHENWTVRAIDCM